MRNILYVILVLGTLAILAYGVYLLVRIAQIYKRLRDLNLQRDYEIMLYAALPVTSVDEVAGLIPADARKDLMVEVLERMGRDTDGELRDKVILLYRQLGFYDQRLREAEKGKTAKRAEARNKLASMGLADPAEEPAGEEG